MSKPIQVGDLVVVVRVCCVGYQDISPWLFRVGDVHSVMPRKCACCGTELPDTQFASTSKKYVGFPIPWLKRIPPLDELEGEQRKEELTA